MMQRREQIMLGVLLAAVVIWQGSGWLISTVFGPFQARSEATALLQKSVQEKDDQLLMLARSSKSLKAARGISLPPDATKSKRPDAVNGQRLYMQWLTDLAELCEIEDLKVTPDRRFLKGNDYIAVVVKVDADARYEQLVRFLYLFNRTDLLHRITAMRVSTKESEGDPFLKVQFEAEGIALVDAPSRPELFLQAEIVEDLSDDGTTMRVTGGEDFPKQPGFRIRIKNEFLDVTAIDGDNWTVTRGVDRTQPKSHPNGDLIQLVRQKAAANDHSLEEFRELVATNMFVKPAPPYKMKLMPITDKPFTRGKPIEFTISAQGYDTTKGKPEFTLVGTPPEGLKLEKSGKLTWKPTAEVAAEKYPLSIEVRHPSAPQGMLAETFSITLREPNTPPKLAAAKPPVAFLNREWKFQPKLQLPESALAQLKWKLGEKPPAGLTINEKSGELTWIPDDEVLPGETAVSLVVTDSESPPQSTTLTLQLDVQDDEASFTRLDTIFILGDSKRAFFYDPSKNKKTELHEGDEFSVAELKGTVKQIRRKYIVLQVGTREIRLDAGQSLREAQLAVVKREEASFSR